MSKDMLFHIAGECRELLRLKLEDQPTLYKIRLEKFGSIKIDYRLVVEYESYIKSMNGKPLQVNFLWLSFLPDRMQLTQLGGSIYDLLYADPDFFDLVVDRCYDLLPSKYKN